MIPDRFRKKAASKPAAFAENQHNAVDGKPWKPAGSISLHSTGALTTFGEFEHQQHQPSRPVSPQSLRGSSEASNKENLTSSRIFKQKPTLNARVSCHQAAHKGSILPSTCSSIGSCEDGRSAFRPISGNNRPNSGGMGRTQHIQHAPDPWPTQLQPGSASSGSSFSRGNPICSVSTNSASNSRAHGQHTSSSLGDVASWQSSSSRKQQQQPGWHQPGQLCQQQGLQPSSAVSSCSQRNEGPIASTTISIWELFASPDATMSEPPLSRNSSSSRQQPHSSNIASMPPSSPSWGALHAGAALLRQQPRGSNRQGAVMAPPPLPPPPAQHTLKPLPSPPSFARQQYVAACSSSCDSVGRAVGSQCAPMPADSNRQYSVHEYSSGSSASSVARQPSFASRGRAASPASAKLQDELHRCKQMVDDLAHQQRSGLLLRSPAPQAGQLPVPMSSYSSRDCSGDMGLAFAAPRPQAARQQASVGQPAVQALQSFDCMAPAQEGHVQQQRQQQHMLLPQSLVHAASQHHTSSISRTGSNFSASEGFVEPAARESVMHGSKQENSAGSTASGGSSPAKSTSQLRQPQSQPQEVEQRQTFRPHHSSSGDPGQQLQLLGQPGILGQQQQQHQHWQGQQHRQEQQQPPPFTLAQPAGGSAVAQPTSSVAANAIAGYKKLIDSAQALLEKGQTNYMQMRGYHLNRRQGALGPSSGGLSGAATPTASRPLSRMASCSTSYGQAASHSYTPAPTPSRLSGFGASMMQLNSPTAATASRTAAAATGRLGLSKFAPIVPGLPSSPYRLPGSPAATPVRHSSPGIMQCLNTCSAITQPADSKDTCGSIRNSWPNCSAAPPPSPDWSEYMTPLQGGEASSRKEGGEPRTGTAAAAAAGTGSHRKHSCTPGSTRSPWWKTVEKQQQEQQQQQAATASPANGVRPRVLFEEPSCTAASPSSAAAADVQAAAGYPFGCNSARKVAEGGTERNSTLSGSVGQEQQQGRSEQQGALCSSPISLPDANSSCSGDDSDSDLEDWQETAASSSRSDMLEGRSYAGTPLYSGTGRKRTTPQLGARLSPAVVGCGQASGGGGEEAEEWTVHNNWAASGLEAAFEAAGLDTADGMFSMTDAARTAAATTEAAAGAHDDADKAASTPAVAAAALTPEASCGLASSSRGPSSGRCPLQPISLQHQETPAQQVVPHSAAFSAAGIENMSPVEALDAYSQLVAKLKSKADEVGRIASATPPMISRQDVVAGGGMVVLASPAAACGRWQGSSSFRDE